MIRANKMILATKNQGKVQELRRLLLDVNVEVLSLNDFPHIPAVIEDGETFADNALKKAKAVYDATGIPSLADDSGLEVDALHGAPGIYSARYAGEEATDQDNNEKLLLALRGIPGELRKARFRCTLVFVSNENKTEYFSGTCEGMISDYPAGEGGFGYDPIFYLPEQNKHMAELEAEEKNRISHRAKAMNAFIQWYEVNEVSV